MRSWNAPARAFGVNIVLDAFGAKKMFGRPLRRLKDGGCRVNFYQRATWYSLGRINNRTHRELLIIDGKRRSRVARGIADYWAKEDRGEPPWRDTAFRVEGPVVAGLQGVFAENWLESSSEIIAGASYYPPLEPCGSIAALVFKSSPADRSTVSRMLFHSLIACARESIRISTRYFIPDRGMREALTGAARRGVQVDVLVPGGKHADQPLLRVASRHWFGELLAGGVRVHEYQASMIHQKLLIVDDWWVVMGTTNMDNRSFEHNDEVNVAFPDEGLATQISALYTRDLSQSARVTVDNCATVHSPSAPYPRLRGCWIDSSKFRVPGSRVPGSGFGFGVRGSGSGFGVRGSGSEFGFRVPGSAFGVRVLSSGSEFRVPHSGFGF